MNIPRKKIPEYSSEDQDLLLHKYRKSVYQFSYVLDSFDDFIESGIAKSLASRPIQLPDGSVANLYVRGTTPPMYEDTIDGLEKQMPLYRETALLEGRTYAAKINVGVKIISKSSITESTDEITLLKIPIPVYSHHCYDNKMINQDKNPEDPGCYFIVEGQRNVILLYEKARQNQYIIGLHRGTKEHIPYISQISETPFSTSSTSIYLDKSKSATIVTVELKRYVYSSSSKDGDEESFEDYPDEYVAPTTETVRNTRRDAVNILAVAHVMFDVLVGDKVNFKNRKETIVGQFKQTLSTVIPKDSFFKVWSLFTSTVTQYKAMTKEEIYNLISSGVEINPSDKDRFHKLMVYFSDNVFPVWVEPERKMNIFITMTGRILQYQARDIGLTNRNHWGGIGLIPPGKILMDTFRRKYSGLVSHVNKQIEISKAYVVTASEILTHVLSYDIESKFMSEFRPPNPGSGLSKLKSIKPQTVTRKAIAMAANPINTMDMRAMLTKTRNNARKESVSYEIRGVQPPFFAFMCSFKATENSRCGITKFIASLTVITRDSDPLELMHTLLNKPFTKLNGSVVSSKYNADRTLPVTVNGLLIGYTNEEYGYDNIIQLKRRNIISRFTAVVKTPSGTLELYSDSNRLMIPVVVIDQKTGQPAIYNFEEWKSMTFDDMLSLGLIEYLDNYEIENKTVTVAQTFASLENYKIELEALEKSLKDSTFKNKENVKHEINTMKLGRYKYALLHPISIYSITIALGIDPSRMQACRVAFADKMQCQTLHTGLGVPGEFVSGYTSTFCTKSVVNSSVSNIVGLEDEIGGQTVTILFSSTYQNQEDAVVVNRDLIDKGLFRWQGTVIIKHVLDANEKFGYVNNGMVAPYHLRNLNDNGMPTIGTYVSEGDVVLGIYEESKVETNGKLKSIIIDRSITLERDEWGYIKEVVSYYSLKSCKNCARQKTVMIKLVRYGKFQAGDKLATRHAQKHIGAAIFPSVDMPFSGSTVAGMMINSLCVPTRMTPGTLFEPFIGAATSTDGIIRDMGAHKPMNIVEIQDALVKAGFARDGKTLWTSGVTGETIEGLAFSGPSRVNLLAHIADQKMQCRAIGNKNKVTGQAESSKYGVARNKGQKIAEQERNQMLKYSSKFLIWERMNISCDAVTVVICLICSSYATYDPETYKYYCNTCGTTRSGNKCSELFGKYIQTQTSMYLTAALTSIGIRPKPKFITAKEYLSRTGTIPNDSAICTSVDIDVDIEDAGEMD